MIEKVVEMDERKKKFCPKLTKKVPLNFCKN
jgi:hypothetical protein